MSEAKQAVPSLSFDSATFPSAEDAFWAWRDLVSVVFDIAAPGPQAVAGFSCCMRAWHPGPLLISRARSSAQHFRRAGPAIARGGIDHYLVQPNLSGGFSGNADGREIAVRPGDISVLDLVRPMYSSASGSDSISLLIPRVLLAPMLKAPDDVHGAVLSGETGCGMILGDHMQSLVARIPAMSMPDCASLLAGTVALIAGCIGATPQVQGLAAQEVRVALLVRIRRHIDQHLADADLTAQTVCERFGLSRSSLHRLFEVSGGFARYVQERRLRRCFAEIVGPGSKRIADVAFAWGFNNESVFSRAFRRMFHVSPRQARAAAQQHRGGGAHQPAWGRTSGNPLADWVLGLTGE